MFRFSDGVISACTRPEMRSLFCQVTSRLLLVVDVAAASVHGERAAHGDEVVDQRSAGGEATLHGVPLTDGDAVVRARREGRASAW